MDIITAILIIGFALMNSDIPQGVANRGKLHVVHGMFVGIAIVVCIYLWNCYSSVIRSGSPGGSEDGSWRPVPPILHVTELTFSEVPVRVYEPTAGSLGLRKGLVYINGGGWALDTASEVCRHIAKEAETTVVSVGYRLIPEHQYPTQKNGHLLSPCAQVLIYPVLQMADFNLPSYQQNHAVPILFCGRMAFYFLQYLNGDTSVCQDVLEGNHIPAEMRLAFKEWFSPEHLPPECRVRCHRQHVHSALITTEVYHKIKDRLDPVSPLLEDNTVIRLTPPAFILTCVYDMLRDVGILYRKWLLDLELEVTWHHMPDRWLTFPSATWAVDRTLNYVKTL
uniref:Arylacetamide deacetylase-like 4 n=1 Tax=Oncorhynchus tshawytscha TaxID=74940 RepID=A0A8C8H2V2_ONCTS